jgi:hypothetical protein
MSNPLVSCIVLNWNGETLLEECLGSLLECDYTPLEIIVVDNASEDTSVNIVKKFPSVRLIRNKHNLGYAAGNNVGFRHATGKYVVTLNNDIVVSRSWLDTPVSYCESDKTIGSASCRQMNYFNRDIIDSLYAYPLQNLLFYQEGYRQRLDRHERYTHPGFVIAPNGASAVYRKEMLDTVGGFDERFYAYNEESDLAMRGFLSGWKCLYVPTAVVYHKRSVSFDKKIGELLFLGERNRLWFIYKYFPLSFILSRSGALLMREILSLGILTFKKRAPEIYFTSRYRGLRGMSQYRATRKQNCPLFLHKKEMFVRFMKQRIIPMK